MKGVFIRVGSSKRRASDSEIQRMMNRHIANIFDSEKIPNPNLRFDYVKKNFEFQNKKFDIIGLDFKRNDSDKYNQAALIISDESPYTAKLAVFDGLSPLTFKDKKIFTGSIAQQIDESLKYIHLINQVSIEFGVDGRRIEGYSYPVNAVREAIINAFVHRDYTLSSDIKIELYDDRLEISSPGSLPDGLTIDDIKNGANAKRNPIINALDKMEYIENYGTGVRRIVALYEGFPREPMFIATHNLFTVILYNQNYEINKVFSSQDKYQIVDLLRAKKIASRQEIQDSLGVQKSFALNLISDLKKQGIISSTGKGVATRYFLN
jgi:predicted HTH transcriptional regulator